MGISWSHGQDSFWDLLNYHLYNAWALLNHVPYHFAASIQGYFDPYLDVPYYILATGILARHPQILQALVGIPYGVLLFEIYLLARVVLQECLHEHAWQRHVLVVLTVLLAATGAPLWMQIGTTSNEITVAAVVMAGVLALTRDTRLRDHPSAQYRNTIHVGFWLGLATGLKLTAGVYLPAAGIYYLFFSPATGSRRFWLAATYSISAIAVAAVAYGPWGWHLYQQTGNPFFPMFNDIFHSPFASAHSAGRDVRFLPKDALQTVFYPFYWLQYNTSVNEIPFRDARYALYFVIFSVFIIVDISNKSLDGVLYRTTKLRVLLVFGTISYIVWLGMFSILRYSIVVEIMMAVATVGMVILMLRIVFPRSHWLAVAVMVFAVVEYGRSQILPTVAYSARTFETSAIQIKPHSVVILANQPMGILAPLLAADHPGVTFVGMPSKFGRGGWMYRGFYAYGVGQDLRKLITQHANHLLVAYYVDRPPHFPGLDTFDIVMKQNECQDFTTNLTSPVRLCKARWTPGASPTTGPGTYHLVPDVIAQPGVVVHVVWAANVCSSSAQLAQAQFEWRVPAHYTSVQMYVTKPPGPKTQFAGGGTTGRAKTGHWVSAGDIFTLQSQTGAPLATVRIRYTNCTNSRQMK